MTHGPAGTELRSESIVVLGVLFGIVGSHEVATQFCGRPLHGGLDGPRAVAAGLAMLLFGVCSIMVYVEKLPVPVRRHRDSFVALFVGAVATPHIEMFCGVSSRFMAVSFVALLLLALITAHVLHAAALRAMDQRDLNTR